LALDYHESDHLLNAAYNVLSGGQRLEDIELWRQDESFLDVLPRGQREQTCGAGQRTHCPIICPHLWMGARGGRRKLAEESKVE
jgi:hypothetical protein